MARVQGIVDKTGTSILSHVLLHAENDKLSITATDSNMSLISIYGARIEQPGSICVKAHRFFQVIKSLEDKTVHVKLKTGNRLDVKSGKANELLNVKARMNFTHHQIRSQLFNRNRIF